MALDEGIQFRPGNTEIAGLNATLEGELQSKIRPGDVLRGQVIADFYQDHKSELPEEVLAEDTAFHRNIKERTADHCLIFRSCSQLQKLRQNAWAMYRACLVGERRMASLVVICAVLAVGLVLVIYGTIAKNSWELIWEKSPAHAAARCSQK